MAFFDTYIRTIKDAPRALRLYLLSTIVYWLGATLVQLYLNFFLQGLGLDQGWIGIINAAPQLVVVLMTLVIGSTSARMGPWRAGLLGGCLAATASVVTALVSGGWWVLIAAAAGGLGVGFIWSNSGPFMMAHSESKARATLFSLQAALGTLTGFIAYMFGGKLPAFFGSLLGQPGDSLVVMRAILLVAAFFYVLSLVPMYMAGRSLRKPAGPFERAEQTEEEQLQAQVQESTGARRRKLVSDRGLVFKLILPGTLIGLGAGMTMPFMNLYIEGKFVVSFENLGQIFAWTAVATAVALMVQPAIADRFGKVKSVVIVQACSLPFLLVLGYAQYFPLVVVALFVRAALMNMGNPVFMAYSMERIPEKERATFSSLSSSSWSLGWAGGSWFSGMIRDAVGFLPGFNILFAIMATLYASSTVLLWVWFVGQETRQRKLDQEARKQQETRPAAA